MISLERRTRAALARLTLERPRVVEGRPYSSPVTIYEPVTVCACIEPQGPEGGVCSQCGCAVPSPGEAQRLLNALEVTPPLTFPITPPRPCNGT